MNPISVKAILQNSGSVLFVRNQRNELELPGGRPEAGESLEAALAREVQEECGLKMTSAEYFASQSCEIIPGKYVLLVFFRGQFIRQAITLSHEHTTYDWVDITGKRPPSLPLFYWNVCQQLYNAPPTRLDVKSPQPID